MASAAGLQLAKNTDDNAKKVCDQTTCGFVDKNVSLLLMWKRTRCFTFS